MADNILSPEHINVDLLTEAQLNLNEYWPKTTEDIKNLTPIDVRTHSLPLARIKRIMKLDEEVKMISAEAPALFSKAAELFITELTMRAWVHTEDNKRRTLQKNDIAMATTKYDQFDFLIDIVPREELKPAKFKEEPTRATLPTDQHYFQIAQQYQTVLQQSNPQTTQSNSATPQTIQIVQATPSIQTAQPTAVTAQVTSQPAEQQQQTQIIQVQQPQQTQTQAPTGGIQIIQQIVGQDGQIQQIPIQLTQQQLQMIRLQMSGATQQPIIIQTAPIQAVTQQSTQATSSNQQPQIIQLQQV